MRNIRLSRIRKKIIIFDSNTEAFLALYGIYKDSIEPDIEYDKFFEMYVSEDLKEIDFTCFYHEDIRVGFSAAFFYCTTINGKKAYIARSATGLIPAFQGKGLHDQYDLYQKFIRFALKHPAEKTWVGAFVINAFVFRDLCRYVPVIYPKPGTDLPGQVQQVINTILASANHLRDEHHPLALEVPIQVRFSDALVARIMESKDPNVQWYLKANPRFLDKCGLLVIVDVSFGNICGTVLNLIAHGAYRKLAGTAKFIKLHAATLIQKTAILVHAIGKRMIL